MAARQQHCFSSASALFWRQLVILTALVWHAYPATALTSDVKRAANSYGTLIAEYPTVDPQSGIRVGLHVRLDAEWHSYWRNPGDSGAAPILDWNLPEGWQAGPIEYLTPQRIDVPPLTTFGYEGETLYTVQLTPPADWNESELKIEVEAEWLVCKVECIPALADFSMVIPVASRTDAEPHPVFTRLAKHAPRTVAGSMSILQSTADQIDLQVVSTELGQIEDFFPDPGMGLQFKRPVIAQTDATTWQLTVFKDRSLAIDREDFAGLLIAKATNSDQSIGVLANFGGQASSSGPTTMALLPLVFSALLGGLLLNLMPCVFPVLGIKFLSMSREAGGELSRIRQSSLAYVAGVVLSFLALGLLVLGLRSAGIAIGWGFQLQSPIFVGALALLFFALGMNFLGFFDIPGFNGDLLNKGLSQKGVTGDFLSGLLATVAATPCTAPFMGAAVGFALTAGVLEVIAVFLCLGIGMSLPQLGFALYPQLMQRLPRPGAWMETFKQALAFPMFATTIWLVWILNQLDQSWGLVIGLGACLLVSVSIWIQARWASSTSWLPKVTPWLLAGLAVALLSQAQVSSSQSSAGPSSSYGIDWQPFSAQALAAERAAQRPVFVDFTADWCVTCKVNERVTFSDEQLVDEIKAAGIVMMKADWTRRDPEITKFLTEHSRAGVPLYLYYSAQKSSAVVLPEVLTPAIFRSHVFPTDSE